MVLSGETGDCVVQVVMPKGQKQCSKKRIMANVSKQGTESAHRFKWQEEQMQHFKEIVMQEKALVNIMPKSGSYVHLT
jgi:hypothetical protein